MASIFDFPTERHPLIKRAEIAFDGKVNIGIKDGFRLRRWDGKQQCSVYWGSSNLPGHCIELSVSPELSIGRVDYRDVRQWIDEQIKIYGLRGAKHKGSESWPTIGFETHDAYFRFLELVDQLRSGHLAPQKHRAITSSGLPDDQGLPSQPRPIEATATNLVNVFLRKIGNAPSGTVAFRWHAQRIGQTLLRRALIAYWSGACALTGLTVVKLLRASHIKRWAESTDIERLDVHNALLLAPQADAAFDMGFITFDDDGKLLIARDLTNHELETLGLNHTMRLRIPPSSSQRQYLEWHRVHIYRKG